MKRILPILALTAGVLAGCGNEPSTSGDSATGGPDEPAQVATTATTVAPAPASTVAPTASTVAGGEAVPAGWKTCTSAEAGYSIAYPAGWHTDTSGATECRYFDPQPVEYTPRSDGFLFALMAGSPNVSFEVARRPAAGPLTRTLSHQDLTVGGRRAVRYEIEFTDQSPNAYPAGTRLYGYVVETEGAAFDVSTYWVPGEQAADQYRAWKQNVDQAVATLRFH